MKTFQQEAQEKFERGAKEHNTDWETFVNPTKEIKEELLDLYNYANHPKFKQYFMSDYIANWAKKTWVAVDKIQENEK